MVPFAFCYPTLKINSFGKEIFWDTMPFNIEKVKVLMSCLRAYLCKMGVFSSSGVKSS
jgi:hypothetical protein